MVQQNLDRADDLLELAIRGFQEQSIPPFANPEVAFPKAHRTEPQIIDVDAPATQLRTLAYFRPRIAIALGLGLTFLVASFSIFPWETASQKAFGQVQQAIRDLRSAVFEMNSYDGDKLIASHKISYLQPGNIRADSGLDVHVLNMDEVQYMQIDDANRTTTIQPIYNLASMQQLAAGSFGALLSLKSIEGTSMRDTEFRGRPAREFTTVWDGSVATVIVNPETNLPVQIELDRGKSQTGKPLREVVSNFEFNVDLDISTFDISPPANYELVRIESREPIVASESLVATPGKGLGPVRFGMSLNEVVNLLGEPDAVESKPAMEAEVDDKGQLKLPMKLVPANPPYNVVLMHYRSLGVRIDISSLDGVQWIRCHEKTLFHKQFAGKTSEGIQIGMSKKEVLSLLEPRLKSTAENWQAVDDRWLLNGMDIEFKKDKCVGISLGITNFLQ